MKAAKKLMSRASRRIICKQVAYHLGQLILDFRVAIVKKNNIFNVSDKHRVIKSFDK